MVQIVQKCDRTLHTKKRAARTHIPHTFQNGFRTHMHTCDRTSHMCVRARTFATHSLRNNTFKHQFVCRLSVNICSVPQAAVKNQKAYQIFLSTSIKALIRTTFFKIPEWRVSCHRRSEQFFVVQVHLIKNFLNFFTSSSEKGKDLDNIFMK